MFDWIEHQDGNKSYWKSLGKVCGRDAPPIFNSTSKRMKVTFHSNDRVQGDGFMAQWYENCGGVFEVTKKMQTIKSPSYPALYKPNLFCNYTLVAPGNDIVVRFKEFQLERSEQSLTIRYRRSLHQLRETVAVLTFLFLRKSDKLCIHMLETFS